MPTLFAYDPSRNLYKRLDTTSGQTTQLITIGGVEFVTKPNGTVDVRRYLPGGIQRTTTYTDGAPGATTQRYLLKDHLGSIDVILTSAGAVEQAMSFDAWGLRRTTTVGTNLWSPLNVATLAAFDHSKTTKGYTGHEMVDEVGIIHMGGRIYDPRIGRFLQADPTLQAPAFTQNYNRYSYVVNNPLTLTDPTGYKYTWLDEGNGWLAVTTVVLNVACSGCAWQVFAGLNATLGAMNASMNGGNIAVGAFTGALLGGLGGYFGAPASWGAFEYSAYAVAGGITSMLQGGNFGNGFVVAGLSTWGGQAFGSVTGLNATPVGQIVSRAVVGGTASALVGDKFANGAAFAAFAAAISAGLSELDYAPSGNVECIPADACAGGSYEPVYVYDRATANAYSEADAKYAVLKVIDVIGLIAGPEMLAFKAVGMFGKAVKTAGQLGREGEAAVRAAYDIGDKTAISIGGRTRIPDGINPLSGTLSEVKNVESLSFTRQLRDYMNYSQQQGFRFDLYTRPDTRLSAPLQNAIDSGFINQMHIP